MPAFTILENTFGAEALGADVILGDVDGANRVDRNSEALRYCTNRKFRRPEQFDHAIASLTFHPRSASPESTVTQNLSHSGMGIGKDRSISDVLK